MTVTLETTVSNIKTRILNKQLYYCWNKKDFVCGNWRIPIMEFYVQVKGLRISSDAGINIDRYRLNRSA
ncbi:MAG TPA: hypothetical protein VFH19_07000 [Nitrososphaeraceae archaeon]|nr:hypothetical protein [Nitrososphaeraceae archaeon]